MSCEDQRHRTYSVKRIAHSPPIHIYNTVACNDCRFSLGSCHLGRHSLFLTENTAILYKLYPSDPSGACVGQFCPPSVPALQSELMLGIHLREIWRPEALGFVGIARRIERWLRSWTFVGFHMCRRLLTYTVEEQSLGKSRQNSLKPSRRNIQAKL